MSTFKFLLTLLPLLLLSGCGDTDRWIPPSIRSHHSDLGDHLVYFRDDRTSLCFAALPNLTAYSYTVYSITNVPCVAVREK